MGQRTGQSADAVRPICRRSGLCGDAVIPRVRGRAKESYPRPCSQKAWKVGGLPMVFRAVELHGRPGRLVVQAARRPRTGRAAAAKRTRARGVDRLLDELTPARSVRAVSWKHRHSFEFDCSVVSGRAVHDPLRTPAACFAPSQARCWRDRIESTNINLSLDQERRAHRRPRP